MMPYIRAPEEIIAGQNHCDMCPRSDTLLTYMTSVVLTAEFVLGGDAR
jgi:hypothetical protein